MTDLERLTEALDEWNDPEARPLTNVDGMTAILNAAMAYRDLLANPAEPDYEAAAALWNEGGHTIKEYIEAAVAGRLLVEKP